MRFAEFDQGADEYNVKICNKCRDFLCTRASQSRSFVVLGSGRGGGGGGSESESESESPTSLGEHKRQHAGAFGCVFKSTQSQLQNRVLSTCYK